MTSQSNLELEPLNKTNDVNGSAYQSSNTSVSGKGITGVRKS